MYPYSSVVSAESWMFYMQTLIQFVKKIKSYAVPVIPLEQSTCTYNCVVYISNAALLDVGEKSDYWPILDFKKAIGVHVNMLLCHLT